jgi:predicted enzyme related to lactoylglutathione lyase
MIDINLLFAAVPVRDFDAATAWYATLFGRPADVPVKADEVMWKITETAWLYVLQDDERAGRTVVTVAVPDLDHAGAQISARGVAPGPIQTIGTAGRKAPFTDADGNTIAYIEVLG